MGWAKFDDRYSEHPKVVAAGPIAELVDRRGIEYCARQETDGFISEQQARRLCLDLVLDIGIDWVECVKRLVEVGRWVEVAGGYEVHDYLKYNPSHAARENEREIARRRSAMNANPDLARAIKERDGDRCRYCASPVNWRDRKGPSGGTYDHVLPVSQGGDEAFTNLVTACRKCNLTKGPRTPEQAGMVLLVPIQTESGRNLDGGGSESRQPVPGPAPVTIEGQKLGAADADAPPKQTRAYKLPDDFEPTDAHRQLAAERGVDLAEALDKMRDWAKSNGTTKKDWDATFRNWLRNEKPTARSRGKPAVSTHDAEMEANRDNPDYWTQRYTG